MKKKFILAALSIMIVFAMTACGSSASDSSGSAAANVTTTEAAAAEEAEATGTEEAEAEEAEAEEAEAEETEAEETEAETQTAENEIIFEGLTVVDNDECSIEITGMKTDSVWGDQLTILLENKSDEKTYMFSVQSLSVNDLEISNLFASTVAPGKKSNETLEISDSSTEKAGITEATDIEITFKVYDDDDWFADPVALETAHVYLYGEDKAKPYVREAQSTDTVLADDDNITVIVTGYDPESFWGYAVELYLVNKTDKDLMFSTFNESINGYMADPFYAQTVSAGKSAFSSISWFSSDLEENEIENVEEIEFTLRVYESDNYMDEDIFRETITLNP